MVFLLIDVFLVGKGKGFSDPFSKICIREKGDGTKVSIHTQTKRETPLWGTHVDDSNCSPLVSSTLMTYAQLYLNRSPSCHTIEHHNVINTLLY